MSLEVVFLSSAEQDLKDLRTYLIKNFGRETWLTTFSKIQASVATLQSFPLVGSVPEELQNLDLAQYRQIISGMNRIIYEVRQQTLYIHIVCDCRRDIKRLLTRRLLRTP